MTLLHLISAADWAEVRRTGEIRPLPGTGFVHLSTAEQVRLPAERLFAGRHDVLLLDVDPAGLDVRWEPGLPTDPGSMLFPHAYGTVPVSAVRAVTPYLPGPGGFDDPPSDRTVSAPTS